MSFRAELKSNSFLRLELNDNYSHGTPKGVRRTSLVCWRYKHRTPNGVSMHMDFLFLNDIAFPVRRGVLSRGRKELGDYCWELEIYCDESPQLDRHLTRPRVL